MANYGKGITVASGFDLAGNPVDSKYLVATLAEANAFINNGVAYEGMQVYCTADKTIYVFNGTSFQTMQKSSGAVEIDLTPYATKESPALTGTPTAPTAAAGTATTQVATTAFVKDAVDTASTTASNELADAVEEINKSIEETNAAVEAANKAIDEHNHDDKYLGIDANAVSATKFAEAKNINGVAFDGTQDITIDIGVEGPAASTDAHVAVFDGATGKLIKDSGFTIRSSVPADAVFTDTTYTLESFGIEATAEEINFVKGVTSDIQTQLNAKAAEGHKHDADYLGINANAVSASKLAEAKNISVSGDATGSASFDGSADTTIAVTLANSGVTAGSYTKVTVDAKGRVTAGAALEASDIPTLTLAKISDAGTAAAKDVGTAAGNVPVLDASGKLDTAILPSITVTDTFVVASEEEMLTVDAQVGDVVVRTDENKTYILQKEGANVLGNWVALAAPTDSGYVSAVNGKTGAVTLTTSDIAEGSNLYFTEARATANFETNIAATNVSALADGANVVLDTDEIIIDCGGAA